MKMNLYRDQQGQTLVVFAVFLGLAGIAFLALALDIGTLFRQKRMAQSAADAAAVAAAGEVTAGNTSNKQALANAIAKLNGFDTTLATNPATVALATPSAGNFTGTGYVQATVSRPIHTLFLSTFSSHFSTMSVSATAIAGGTSSPTCVCITNKTGQDIFMSGTGTLNANGCGIVDNSSAGNAIEISGGATLKGTSFGIVSTTWNNNTNINNGGNITSTTTVVQGITSTCAPTLPAAPTWSSCNADPGGGSTSFTAGPASASDVICYNGLTIGANATLDTLKPGIYVINNGYLTFDAGTGGKSNLGGNGVFFYLTGTASLTIQNGANVNLVSGGSPLSGGGTAPTVGAYNGILFYQASSDSQAVSIQGGSSVYMKGAIYAPSADLTIDNGSTASMSGGIAANTLTMKGAGTVNATADISAGSLTITAPKLVQ
jgi:Flp pilus assembly protein TadG